MEHKKIFFFFLVVTVIQLQFCSLKTMALYYCRNRALHFSIGTIKTHITVFQMEPFWEPVTATSLHFSVKKISLIYPWILFLKVIKHTIVRSTRVEMTIFSSDKEDNQDDN